MADIILIAHNLRSAHNVGSLLRTADGIGVSKVLLSGYTPYPLANNDTRLPHLARKINSQIVKTSLGAETMISWQHVLDLPSVIAQLKADGFRIVGLEQATQSTPINAFKTPEKIALIVGREVEGLEPETIALCDELVEIPMFGRKESFNVVQAAAMALYQLRLVN